MVEDMQVGPYVVVRLLGRGGSGSVYEVRRAGVTTPLALKQLNRNGADARTLDRFAREAALLSRVRHPNVVRVIESGASDQGPFLVTERVVGEDLGVVVARGALDPRRAARLVHELCGAVAAVHAEGIVHRDLKPENVLLRPDDTPVLLDFGLAREGGGERLTDTGAILGTPVYMAPEQARAISPDELDVRVDVYGLGALLFTLVAGHPPFTGQTVVEVLSKVLREEPHWTWLERPGVPAGLVAICRVALAKAREQRHASVEELGLDIARLLRGEPVLARPPVPTEPAPRAKRRGRDAPPPPSARSASTVVDPRPGDRRA